MGFPALIAFYKNLIKTAGPSFKFKTFNEFSYFLLIQFTACNWGSIHKGHLLDLVVNIPFWTDNSSDGNYSDAHWAISTSDVKRS